METTPAVAGHRSQGSAEEPDAVAHRVIPCAIDYSAIVAAAADCTTVTGADGLLRYVSPACGRLLGWTESELEGSPADDFVHPDDVDELQQACKGLVLGEPITLSYRLRCRDGAFRWVEAT